MLDATVAAGRVMRPAAQSLFFCAKAKEPKERRPNCLRPPLALREPAVRALSGVWLNSLALRQTPALIRPKLCSSAHTNGDPRERGRPGTAGHRAGHELEELLAAVEVPRTSAGAPTQLRARHDGALRAPDCDPGVPLCKAPRSAVQRGSAGRVFERSEFASCPRWASTAGSPTL